MINDAIPLGSVSRLPYACLAFSAARRIAQEDGKLVGLGIRDDGEAYLDTPEEVDHEEAVGFYRGGIPKELEQTIYQDLRHVARDRGLRK